jgi:hypothetical protein
MQRICLIAVVQVEKEPVIKASQLVPKKQQKVSHTLQNAKDAEPKVPC